MTPEQKATERFPDAHIPNCPETTQFKMEEVYKLRRAFVLGAEWQAGQDGWISVLDSMPQPGEHVIVFGKEIGVSKHICLSFNNIFVKAHDKVHYNWMHYITHYKLLPQPPKQ